MSRRRWQGTRTSFVDLVLALERCMHNAAGATDITLRVQIGDHEGGLAPQDLRNELTEALWLGSRTISVLLSPSDYNQGRLSVVLSLPEPVLFLAFHGGTTRSRETLRAVAERSLPNERRDPRRHWRWVGPIFGCAYAATIWLIGTRVPETGVEWHVSPTVRDILTLLGPTLNVAIGTWWSWLAFRLWFPPLERLPDTAETHWGRRRAWVQVGLGVWFSLVLGLLALPSTR